MKLIVGIFLYSAIAIDHTLLTALNAIAAKQATATKQTEDICHRVLDYIAIQPNVSLVFQKSDMVLTIDLDADYLVEPQSRIRFAGYFQLNSNKKSSNFVNGEILIECKTLRHVVASSVEEETAGKFHNSQVPIQLIYILNQMGHPQPATLLKTYNAAVNLFVHDNITQKK